MVITDGTGGLPKHMLRVLLSQFPTLHQNPDYRIFCDTPERIRELFAGPIQRDSIVFHAVAVPQLKQQIESLSRSASIPCHDLTGGAVEFLASASGHAAANDPSLIHSHDDSYFDRIDAWEFTMQHDDSRRLESLHLADIVLLGLSRVSKTPTSAYLGWLGHRVANVSFTPACGIPDEIRREKEKVVALTIQPKQLAEIRARRMQVNGFAAVLGTGEDDETGYSNLRSTIKECMAAERDYRKLNIPTLDVTGATIEETAARVLEILQRRKAAASTSQSGKLPRKTKKRSLRSRSKAKR